MSSTILNPLKIFTDVWSHRYLLGQLIRRDVLLRYRGAMFGVVWVFLTPLLMLAIFVFVFGEVFQARWTQRVGAPPFWLMLYAGLIVFNLFAETVSRAPMTVRGYPSYVKRIIFPLQILPLVPLGASMVHGGINLLILFTALAWTGYFSASLLLFPLLVLPVLFFSVGLAWFLGAWGVYIKDMTQIVPLFVQMLMFLSPVFYPVDAVPPELRLLYQINPLSTVIEATRALLLETPIPWRGWGAALLFSALAATLGHRFFQHARDEFADAL